MYSGDASAICGPVHHFRLAKDLGTLGSLNIEKEASAKDSIECYSFYYPRDAMLARVLAMTRCLSVCLCMCLPQVSVLSKQLNESRWFLAWELLIPHILHCIKKNSGIFKNRDTPLWNFVPNSELGKFCSAYRSSKRVINSSRER